VALKISYAYIYITKLFRTQAEVIVNHRNATYVVSDKEKPCIESIRG
jgi:hypothetical protein